MSLSENKYIRYFAGHSKVISINFYTHLKMFEKKKISFGAFKEFICMSLKHFKIINLINKMYQIQYRRLTNFVSLSTDKKGRFQLDITVKLKRYPVLG